MAIPLSRRLDFSEIPQIDAGPLLRGDADEGVIGDLASACTDVGFFYVRNHGVPQDLIAGLRHEASLFFGKPMEEKLKVHIDPRLRGYLPLDYSSYENEEREARSHQEGFWIGYDRPLNDRQPLEGPNVWPGGHPGLKDVMLRYQTAVEPLIGALESGFAQACGLPADGLSRFFERPMTRLKLNHYPPQDNPETVKHIGVVPHTDSGAFTILWQDDGDGLEIQNKSGEWIGAPSIPETFVINIGNIMQIWTNGKFSSTPHRVINRGGRDRHSIPVFVYPGHDAPIGPLDGAAATGKPVACGDYLRDIWKRTFPVAGIA
ncbi:MAG: isopenicillin N synthase family dioxygenase [Hyphomicrobiaceae bacterium]